MKWKVLVHDPDRRDPKVVVLEADEIRYGDGGILSLTTTTTERLPNGSGGVGDFTRIDLVASFGPSWWIEVRPVRSTKGTKTRERGR